MEGTISIVQISALLCSLLISESTIFRPFLPEESEFSVMSGFLETAIQYTPNCLIVYLQQEDPLLVSKSTFFDPIVQIQASTIREKHNWTEFLNNPIFTQTCITLVSDEIPVSGIIFGFINWKKERKANLYFIFKSDNVQISKKFLLNPAYLWEENIIVLIREEKWQWVVYMRQLYTPNHTPEIKIINFWNSQSRELASKETIFPEQMKNFYGTQLRGTSLFFEPFAQYEATEALENELPVTPRLSLDFLMLEEIMRVLNGSFQVIRPTSGLWSFTKPDGFYEGVTGDVQKGVANFSLVLSITVDRYANLDFSDAYYMDTLVIVTNTLAQNNDQWKKILTPFQELVWLILVITMSFAFLVYFYLMKRRDKRKHPISKSILDLTGSFLSQSLKEVPRKTSTRLFFAIWIYYSLLITIYYKSSLMASLVVPPTPPRIDTLEQLLNSKLHYGLSNLKGSDYDLFATSEVHLYSELFKNFEFFTPNEFYLKVADEGYGFIYFKSNIDTVIASKPGYSKLYTARDEFFPNSFAWAFPLGSPMRRVFNQIMVRCLEHGLQKQWLKQVRAVPYIVKPEEKLPKAVNETTTTTGAQVVLSLSHMQGAFFTLAVGYGFGILIFLAEILIFSFKSRSNKF